MCRRRNGFSRNLIASLPSFPIRLDVRHNIQVVARFSNANVTKGYMRQLPDDPPFRHAQCQTGKRRIADFAMPYSVKPSEHPNDQLERSTLHRIDHRLRPLLPERCLGPSMERTSRELSFNVPPLNLPTDGVLMPLSLRFSGALVIFTFSKMTPFSVASFLRAVSRLAAFALMPLR